MASSFIGLPFHSDTFVGVRRGRWMVAGVALFSPFLRVWSLGPDFGGAATPGIDGGAHSIRKRCRCQKLGQSFGPTDGIQYFLPARHRRGFRPPFRMVKPVVGDAEPHWYLIDRDWLRLFRVGFGGKSVLLQHDAHSDRSRARGL